MKLENALGDAMVTTIPESKTIQAGNSVISNTKTGSFGDITFYETGKYTFTVTEMKPGEGCYRRCYVLSGKVHGDGAGG